jgi:tetratricopeptide (TPR) repeat protein
MDEIYLQAPPIDNENKLSALSNTRQILATSVHQPPTALFGSEPSPDWCYFFEKADLARQLGDWEEVIRLWDAATSAGYSPQNGVELLSFVEAYTQLGNLPMAETLSRQALEKTENLEPTLCTLWKRLESQSTPGPERQEAIQRLHAVLQCDSGATTP